jgi:hypothetical protein
VDVNRFIREHLPGRYKESGSELYLRVDDGVQLIRLARTYGLTPLGVEYFVEIDERRHSPVGIDYWSNDVSVADRYDELEAKYASGYPWGATLAVLAFRSCKLDVRDAAPVGVAEPG